MKAEHTLNVERRERTGTRYSKRERTAGKLPCVLYGQGKDPAHLLLEHKDAIRFFESGERVFEISIEAAGVTQTVLLKDLQFGHLGTHVVHCDLMRVDLSDVVEANVHIRLVGAPTLGSTGILVQKLTELPVKCAVSDLPEEITLDIAKLGPGEHIEAKDIAVPEGVENRADPETSVVIITTAGGESTDSDGEGEMGEEGEGTPEA